jgi:hypothetical protein
MQDRATIKAAGDHGRAHDLGRMGVMGWVAMTAPDDMAETDIGAGWAGSPLNRAAAEAEAQSGGRGRGRRFASRIMARTPGDRGPAIFRARSHCEWRSDWIARQPTTFGGRARTTLI